MKLAKVALWIASMSFLFSGLLYLLVPETMAVLAGISVEAGGVTDFRAVYAGSQLGLSFFLLWCLRDPSRFAAGLLALGCLVAATALVRMGGMGSDIGFPPSNMVSLGLEIPLVVLAAWGSASLSGVTEQGPEADPSTSGALGGDLP